MKSKPISSKKYNCDRCGQLVPAYYIDTNGVQGLYVQCPVDSNHARPYVSGLDLPYKVNKKFVDKPLSLQNNKPANHHKNKQKTLFTLPEFKDRILKRMPHLRRARIVFV